MGQQINIGAQSHGFMGIGWFETWGPTLSFYTIVSNEMSLISNEAVILGYSLKKKTVHVNSKLIIKTQYFKRFEFHNMNGGKTKIIFVFFSSKIIIGEYTV